MSEEATTPAAEPNYSLLAQQAFGDDYKGEVREIPLEPEVQPEAPEEPVEALEEDPEQALEEPVETPTDEPEEVEISTLSQLIETNNYDPEWFNALEVDVKVDGNPSKVKIADLINSHQMTEAAQKRLEDAKEKAKTQNQALAQKQEQVEQTFQVAGKLIEKVESKLTKDFENIDWNALKNKDEVEYLSKKMEFDERRKDLDSLKQEAISEWQKNQQGSQEEFQAARSQALQAEHEALLSKIPEWTDADTAKKEKGELSQYLVNQGLTQEEVGNASDHRLIIMARKAMLYDQSQGKTEPAKKKLALVPKTLKPGTPKSAAETNQSKENQLRARIRSNPNSANALDDAVSLLQSRRDKR